MSHVPTTNLTALYSNTTSGTAASPTIVDAAVQDIVQTVNDNDDATTVATAGFQTQIDNKAPLAHVGSGGTGVHAPATNAASGFMSAADKTKLDGVTAGLVASYAIAANQDLTFGGRFKIVYTTATDTLDIVEY